MSYRVRRQDQVRKVGALNIEAYDRLLIDVLRSVLQTSADMALRRALDDEELYENVELFSMEQLDATLLDRLERKLQGNFSQDLRTRLVKTLYGPRLERLSGTRGYREREEEFLNDEAVAASC